MHEFLLARGRCGKIYKTESSTGVFVRKEFSPTLAVRLWNWSCYRSPHPASTEWAPRYAFWKRRLASRLSLVVGQNPHICDALRFEPKGFITEFIEGRTPVWNERKYIHEVSKKLERFFEEIGMPTWSFSRRNPFAIANFIIRDERIFVVDYEQSIPAPDSKGMIGYDEIYFEELERFIIGHRQKLLDKLGTAEMQSLDEAFEEARLYRFRLDIRPRWFLKLTEKLFRR